MLSETNGFFNDLSKVYDKKYIKKYFKRNHIWIFKNLISLEGKNILDIGCGTGELAMEIKKLYPNCSITGVDISEGMISKAQSKCSELDNIRYLVGDVHALDFEDNTFDVVLNTISFHHYQQPLVALNEIKRVMKTEGRLYLLDSVRDPSLISFMPHYWDYVDSKTCYSKHLYTKEFFELFNKTNFRKVSYKKHYKLFPAVHLLSIAEK